MKRQATPYLMFNGNAKEALEYYKEIFEGEILDVQTYANAGYETQDGLKPASFMVNSKRTNSY